MVSDLLLARLARTQTRAHGLCVVLRLGFMNVPGHHRFERIY
jgi:hypothetical protein